MKATFLPVLALVVCVVQGNGHLPPYECDGEQRSSMESTMVAATTDSGLSQELEVDFTGEKVFKIDRFEVFLDCTLNPSNASLIGMVVKAPDDEQLPDASIVEMADGVWQGKILTDDFGTGKSIYSFNGNWTLMLELSDFRTYQENVQSTHSSSACPNKDIRWTIAPDFKRKRLP